MDTETLKRETLIENDAVSLWYYPDLKIIHHKFHKFIMGDKFKEAMLKGAEYFEKYKCTKWLSDDRNSSALRRGDVEWGYESWQPKVFKAGWKYWAVVMPDLMAGKLTMRSIIDYYKERNVIVEIFDDIDLALKWLIENN
jgi:hypothetical protein